MQPDRGGLPDVEDRGRDAPSPAPVPAPGAGEGAARSAGAEDGDRNSGLDSHLDSDRDRGSADDGDGDKPASRGAVSTGGTGNSTRSPLKRVVLVGCLLLAFRGALFVQQAALFASLSAAGCGPGIQLNGVSASVTGLESCGDAGLPAALVGTFAGVAVAVPLLLWFPRRATTVPRAVAAFLYLLALASVAEVVSGSFVMSILGKFESGHAVELGVPLAVFVVAGLGFAAACFPTLKKTASTFVLDVLHHDEKHVQLMEKAVVFKLTAGVVFISLMRILTAG